VESIAEQAVDARRAWRPAIEAGMMAGRLEIDISKYYLSKIVNHRAAPMWVAWEFS